MNSSDICPICNKKFILRSGSKACDNSQNHSLYIFNDNTGAVYLMNCKLLISFFNKKNIKLNNSGYQYFKIPNYVEYNFDKISEFLNLLETYKILE